jgi:hypothetical protein
MTMLLRHIAVAFLIVCTCQRAFGFGQQSARAELSSTSRPFTAEFEETVTSARGDTRIASYQTIAVNTDGTRLLALGLHRELRDIVDVDGLSVRAKGNRKSTTQHSPALRRLTSKGCALDREEAISGERVIFGYRAVGRLRRFSDRTSEEWYAADYDCAMVERLLSFSTGEKSILSLRSFTETVEAALFDTATLIEGPPSQLDPDESQRCLASERCRPMMEWRDTQYRDNRQLHRLSQQQ